MQLYRRALNKLIRPKLGVSDGVGLVQTAPFIHTISHSIWVRPCANSQISIKRGGYLSIITSVLTNGLLAVIIRTIGPERPIPVFEIGENPAISKPA